jgi:hypothetical protein
MDTFTVTVNLFTDCSVTPDVPFLQALNPFYIFQLFSCSLWITDMYYWFAACILLITFMSLAIQIFETRAVSSPASISILMSKLCNVFFIVVQQTFVAGNCIANKT